MASFKKHQTRSAANTGARLIIRGQDNEPTEEWVHVLGADSDVFQAATRTSRTQLLDYIEKHGVAAKTSPGYLTFAVGVQRKQQAALVTAWSYDEPCTVDNVCELFVNAPDIAEQVDKFAGDRGKFASVLPQN